MTESVEAVTEATTLLSGLGFESGGIAATHSVHNGLTQLDVVADAACATDETIHNEPFAVEPDMVRDAIRTADGLGQAHKEQNNR